MVTSGGYHGNMWWLPWLYLRYTWRYFRLYSAPPDTSPFTMKLVEVLTVSEISKISKISEIVSPRKHTVIHSTVIVILYLKIFFEPRI